MKLKPTALGNAFGIIAFVAFVLCIFWSAIDRTSFVTFWESWTHGFNLVQSNSNNIATTGAKQIYGLLSFTASGWVTGYSLAWLYDKFAQEK
jgi:hypothetical protein